MIESVKLKFISGNSVPIDRAVITREEYERIMDLTKDGYRYRCLRDSYQDSDYLLTDHGMNTWNDELGMTVEASLDELVDAAMARDREG